MHNMALVHAEMIGIIMIDLTVIHELCLDVLAVLNPITARFGNALFNHLLDYLPRVSLY